MTKKNRKNPDYLFEVSWEVCNKIGGIHTVIATKAHNLSLTYKGEHLFIGPDVWRETNENPEFSEEKNLMKGWRARALDEGLRVRAGRWNIPSSPIVILVDFSSFIPKKDEIFAEFWERYKLDSLSGGWDYIESALFGYAAGRVIESFVRFNMAPHMKAVAQFHEWMTGAGVLYLKNSNIPVSTLFTTHATVLGRSLAGNNLMIYSKDPGYNPMDKVVEFNITAKHSLEKCAAQNADIFTTVSDITASECTRYLGRAPDIVTPNGFEKGLVPSNVDIMSEWREDARKLLIDTASLMTGEDFSNDTFMIATSGRYEFRNKGIDLYLDALAMLNNSGELERDVIAWIFVPGAHDGPDRKLLEKRQNGGDYTTNVSHYLSEPEHDQILKRINELHLLNKGSDRVKLLFVPSYLNGNDGVFDKQYYKLLTGLDMTLFPSYYEPWGYTPLESLAFGVPTVTTTLAGFGLWIKEHSPLSGESAIVLERDDNNYTEVKEQLKESVLKMTLKSKKELISIAKQSVEISETALWDKQVDFFKQACSMAADKIKESTMVLSQVTDHKDHVSYKKDVSNHPNWNKVIVIKKLPESLKPLEIIARNLWWCWNQEAVDLFKLVDKELWKKSEGNPIHLLDMISLKRYQELEADSKFIRKLELVYKMFRDYMDEKEDSALPHVAYFSMEYGLDKSMKIYSGGLGVLAGDYLKEASDIRLPLTAVGLLYKYGYFTQQLSASGDQISHYEPQDLRKIPVTPLRDDSGKWITISIALPGRNMNARLWKTEVGRTELILLDTDFEDNLPEDRAVTHHLYGGDWENRLKQEMLLGIGGVRALRALGVNADVYHLNEGHAAFIGLERLKEFIMQHNLTFAEAVEVVRSSSLFTTHTPVPAGHDSFSEDLMRGYFAHYPPRLKISWDVLMSLGKIDPFNKDEKFSMSNLAANLSQEVNGVSKLHGEVSREILSPLWPGYLPGELHVGYVTNGVHYPTWTAPEWKEIHAEVFGEDFLNHHYNKECFEGIFEVEDNTVWFVRNKLRSRLIKAVKSSLSNPQSSAHYTPQQVVAIKENLRDDVLTVGFARRFATYKRAHLLFTNLERLEKIVNNPERPVQFLFAGKAHPADKAGQDLIRRIVEVSKMPEFIGKVLFVPGYDMTLARHLVQGADIWMNTPTRPLEASGTSGEKAAMNGVMHFSVLDGWWVEGYREGAGWALERDKSYDNQEYQNELDAATIYNMLESEIVPLFYDRNEGKSLLPSRWIETIKNTIAYVASEFTTNRMMNDYISRFYNKLSERHKRVTNNDFAFAREMALWKKKVRKEWPYIEVYEYKKPDYSSSDIVLGETYEAELVISLGDLSPDDIGAELLIAENGTEVVKSIKRSVEFELVEFDKGVARYRCGILADSTGAFNLAGRIYARHPGLPHRQDFDLVRWL